MEHILNELFKERVRQDNKFGEQNHSPIEWLAIITEELGEASKEAVDHHFKYPCKTGHTKLQILQDRRMVCYREELIQLAAVTVQAIQSLDRQTNGNYQPLYHYSRFISNAGSSLIARERLRQITDEGFDGNRDMQYKNNELTRAAMCYLEDPKFRDMTNEDGDTLVESIFPWDREWFKPSPENRIKELVKAGALIAAEIDRLTNEQFGLGQRSVDIDLTEWVEIKSKSNLPTIEGDRYEVLDTDNNKHTYHFKESISDYWLKHFTHWRFKD